MPQEKIPVSRLMVGLIALTCLSAAIALLIFDPQNELWAGGFMRCGLVMGAFWLALPPKGKEDALANLSLSTLLGCILALFVVVRYPRAMIPIILIVAWVGFLLRPRGPRRPHTRRF